MYSFNYIEKNLKTIKSTEEMIKYIDKYENIPAICNLLFILNFKNIPLKLLLNPIFILNIFYRYIFHPNLLIKRLIRLI